MPPVQFAVNAYKARSLPLSAQNLVNLYAEKAPPDAKSQVVLYETPGIKKFAVAGDGPIRGTHVMDGVLYVVSGCILYSVDALGKTVPLGSICVEGAGASGITLPAEGSFTVTGGTANAGTNQITSITVDGEEILAAPVDWGTNNEVTAIATCEAIRDRIGFPDFTYDNVSFEPSLDPNLKPATFKFDGTKIYVSGIPGNDEVTEFTLSTAWNLGTANFSFNTSETVFGTVEGIDFSNDGTKMYLVETATNDKVHQFSLSTAWDLSTSSYDSVSLDVGPETNKPQGIHFKSDGTKFFLASDKTGNAKILQYSLTTAWDLSTASYDSVLLDLTTESFRPTDLFVHSGGKKMWVADILGPLIAQYSLTTAWDLSTASYDELTFDITFADTALQGVAFGFERFSRVYMYAVTVDTSGPQNSLIFQYSQDIKWKCTIRDATVTITGPAGELIVTTAGDVTVDTPVTDIAGGFVMSAGGGTQTLDSDNCVSMAHNAASTPQLCIVDGYNGWIYTTTDGLVRITDPDFLTADTVDFQDQYFVFNRAGTGQFFLSNLNDGTAYTSTDIATAEGDPDNLVAVVSNHRELWLFGSRTIEVWYNSGDADFPFDRLSGSFMERGCAAAHSITRIDNTLYWLGEDRIVYKASGYVPQRISQHAMEAALERYEVVSDVCAFVYTMGGHKFYVMNFPTERVTWVYDASTTLWHQRESRDDTSVSLKRWRASTYVNVYGKHLVGDFETGAVGELDDEIFAEYGNTMQGAAVGPPIDYDRKRVFIQRLELDVETGVGLTSGQGSNPQIELAYSDDGGRTFSARKPWRSMGKIGEYRQRLRWNRQGSSRNRIYKMIVSDPVKRSIVGANIEIQPGLS